MSLALDFFCVLGLESSTPPLEIESQILIPSHSTEHRSRDVLYCRIANLQTKFYLVLNLCTVSVLEKYSKKVIGSLLWQNFCMNIATLQV